MANKDIGFSIWIRRDDGSKPKSFDAMGPGAKGPFILHSAQQPDVVEMAILCTTSEAPLVLYSCKTGDAAPGCVWMPRWCDADGPVVSGEWYRVTMFAEYSDLFRQARAPYN
jgi:hypothetical protein